MSTLTDKQIAELLHKAIKELVAEGVDAFRPGPRAEPCNGICSALQRKINEATEYDDYAYYFMRSFMDDTRLYNEGIGQSGELNDHRIYTILLLDQLSIEDIEFYLDLAPQGTL